MRSRYKQKRSLGKSVVLIMIIALIGALVYFYNSKMFEQKKPTLSMPNTLFWNLKKPIPITVSDESGVKFVRVTLSDGNNTIVLANEVYKTPKQKINLHAVYPRTAFFNKNSKLTLSVRASDNSKWNFFMGNEAEKTIPIKVDTKKPNLYVLSNSYSITQGGTASVIFSATDPNLAKLYIKTDAGDIFKPTPFHKDGFYISLVAWEHNRKNFEADVIAIDKAGNQSKERIKYYILGKNYRISRIKATDKFIDGKITNLTEMFAPNGGADLDKKGKFKFVNETLRKSNEEKITEITQKVSNEQINSFFLKPFYPLKNAAAVASFGDHRYYSYKGQPASESYHLGLDLASTKQANIVASNNGVVVFADENGIYGNNLIISHGLGVYSLYGHCSTFRVGVGDNVKRGDIVAKTGMTGLALGDHLHFGILVQGVEVRPEEWMDRKWFKDNITSVIIDAKKIIDRK